MEEINNVLEEANKCLNCKKPLCRTGCPVKTNIPEFIYQIKQNNFEQAYNILHDNNIMSEICSNICPAEKQCMGSCIKGIKEKPVRINYLEKFVNDWAKQNNVEFNIPLENSINEKVAIIGSGPASMACAIDLRKAGINVTIFEKENKCGGILNHGIPDFRLPKDIVEHLIDKIKAIGVEIIAGVEFGKDITIEDLHEQGFKKIFLGMGLQKQTTYSLTDKATNSIYKSNEFLKAYNEGIHIRNLGTTIIIGGGNVALDSARAALRMGAKEAYILYRRTSELMPARKIELEEAQKDGVKFVFTTKVLKAEIKDAKLKEIECIKTQIENEKAIEIEKSNYIMKADTIIFAIGASSNEEYLHKIGIKTDKGLVCINENCMTNINGIYAGGDLTEYKSTVCKAISTGKKAAQDIIENLSRKEGCI